MFPRQTTTSQIQAIRDQLDRADVQPSAAAQAGMTMIAVSQLLDLVERLEQRILDLEREHAID